MHKRRGRPRLNLPNIDPGTKELQHKRAVLLKNAPVQQVIYAESLLGYLYAHQVISHSLYEAGQFFGELGYRYEACLGQFFRPRTSVLVLNRGGRPTVDDSLDERRTKEGPHPYKVVLKVVFCDQDLYSTELPCFSPREVKSLQRGLTCLEAYFNRRSEKRKRSICDE
jgi:hypothetical protein